MSEQITTVSNTTASEPSTSTAKVGLDHPYTTAEAFCRNIGLVTKEEQLKIENTCVAIAGNGGAGGGYASSLARAGFGSYKLADHDHYELVNFNRQYGATVNSIGRNKAIVTSEIIHSINPLAKIKTYTNGIDESNIDDFLEGVNIVMDALDVFVPKTRRLLYRVAHQKGIPVFTCGPIGYSAAWQVYLPSGPTFDEFCCMDDSMSEVDMVVRHIVTAAPAGTHLKYMKAKSIDFSGHAAPSLGPVCTMMHGILVIEVINYITGRKRIKGVPNYFQFDLMTNQFKTGYLRWGNKNPIQKIKIWYLYKLLERGRKERELEGKKSNNPDETTKNEDSAVVKQ